MNANHMYNPGDNFNRIRPYCIFLLLILLFLLLLFLAPKRAGGNGSGQQAASQGSGAGRGGGDGNSSGKGAGNSRAEEGKGKAPGTEGKGAAAMAEKADPRNTASSSASSSQAPAEKTPSPGRTSSRKEQTENMQPGLPVKEWKTSRKPTVSESEVWFYAKNQIKNIARDKRDVFEFPEFGVPDTGMKKVAENLYEVKGFFKVKTHDGKEKMYRFTIKTNLVNTLSHDMKIEPLTR